MDLEVIADALAARYAPGTLTPPAGEPAIRESTADLPDTISKLPIVIVQAAITEPARFSFGSQTRTGVIPFAVDLALDGGADLPRQSARCMRWAGVIVEQTVSSVHLGLPAIVAQTWTESFQIGDVLYAGLRYPGVRLIVMVRTTEGISPTA